MPDLRPLPMMSSTTRLVIEVLTEGGMARELHCLEVARRAGVRAGNASVTLRRLLAHGWVEVRELPPPAWPRTFYRPVAELVRNRANIGKPLT
jgi:predicted transcriptional regulator